MSVLVMRIMAKLPRNIMGVHNIKCTQNGGWRKTSVSAAPTPTIVPTMVMAKNAGPSAVSYLSSATPQLLQCGRSFITPQKALPLPQIGHFPKKAAFQLGLFLIFLVILCYIRVTFAVRCNTASLGKRKMQRSLKSKV